VLEHIAIVPAAGTGAYNIYLDNFMVVKPRTLTYALAPGAPAGASVNAATGIFTWTPSEAQGPATNSISVIGTDNSSPALSATNTFTVVVNEVNSSPTLNPITNNPVIYAGSTLSFTLSATDADLPSNTLTYSLDPGAPAAASVNAGSGLFLWSTTDADAATTNVISVRVTDDGSPSMSNVRTFTVTVLSRPAIQSVAVSGTNVTLAWNAISNAVFRVEYRNGLSDTNWLPLGSDITATNSTISIADPDFSANPQRFYRLRVMN
jgi:hypothetical protein